MSHEIRTPMNGILGMTELALDTHLSSEQREYLNMARESAQSLLALLNDILDFSKIEAGKLKFEPLPFKLRDCLDQALKSLALRAHQKQLELACRIGPDVPDALIGDPGRLRQVVVNLVGNAIKFTEKGEVFFSCNVESFNIEGTRLHFSVKDTGIGIPIDKQALIFSPFTQADGSTTRKYGGTGLGLSISTRLVEMMGGKIWVESEPGHGSIFHFTAEFSTQQELPYSAPRRSVNLHGIRALIVDDNQTNRRILEELLSYWHMSPMSVDSAEAAIRTLLDAAAENRPFTLALLDVQMPDVDGFTLAAEIKTYPQLRALHLMMLSSVGQRGDAARCREIGIGAYLTKPVRQSYLSDAIQTLLGYQDRYQSEMSLITRHSLLENRRSLRILLAEDNSVNQRLAQRMLQKHGHTVLLAENGLQVLDILEHEKVDLVLMDMQMPEMDGFEATAAIRNRETSTDRRLPIIAMTAHAMKGDRERCLAAGMDGYVAKPIQMYELLESIERVLGSVVGEAPPRLPSTKKLPFDRYAALSLVGGELEILQHLVRLFRSDRNVLMEQISEALQQKDLGQLQTAANHLKRALSGLCARPAVEAAIQIEGCARQGALAYVPKMLQELHDELEQLEPHWEALLSEPSENAEFQY